MKVDPEVMALLSASRTEGNKLFITGGQLDRGLYARLDKTLKAAGGKWNTKARHTCSSMTLPKRSRTSSSLAK